MGGAAGRLGDSIDCGDHVASGSGNVFVNGLPFTHKGKKITTGHGCFPPTVLDTGWSTTVFVNNEVVAMKGVTTIMPHKCGKKGHLGIVSTGSENVFVES
jgi:uncharacterized Zn-binding protein involved in type VI secretion